MHRMIVVAIAVLLLAGCSDSASQEGAHGHEVRGDCEDPSLPDDLQRSTSKTMAIYQGPLGEVDFSEVVAIGKQVAKAQGFHSHYWTVRGTSEHFGEGGLDRSRNLNVFRKNNLQMLCPVNSVAHLSNFPGDGKIRIRFSNPDIVGRERLKRFKRAWFDRMKTELGLELPRYDK